MAPEADLGFGFWISDWGRKPDAESKIQNLKSKIAAASFLGAAVLAGGCASSAAQSGPWVQLQTRQFAVPLVAGTTVVEIRDLQAGWVERVWVESDGRDATGGVPVEPQERVDEPPVDAASAAFFVAQAGGAVDARAPAIERAVALRDWTARRAYGRAGPRGAVEGGARRGAGRRPRPLDSADGRELIGHIDGGGKFNCASLANILHDAARALGLRARRCDLSVRHLSPREGHSIVEVWSDGDGWVVMDPLFNCHYEVDGRPAGALDLHTAVAARRFSSIRVVRAPGAAGKDPRTYGTNPLLFFRNVYLLLPGGRRLTRVDAETPPAPVTNYLHTDSDAAFETGGHPLDQIEIRRGSAHGRLAYQAIGGTLYVSLADGIFRYGALEARTARGVNISFVPDRSPLDANDPLLFAPGDLAANGGLADADADAVPDGWTIKGAPALARDARGALTIEAGNEPCELVLRVGLAPETPAAAFARMRVERGRVTLGLRARGERGAEVVEPGPAVVVSTRVIQARASRVGLRIALSPGSRCVVEHVSLRRALRLGDWS